MKISKKIMSVCLLVFIAILGIFSIMPVSAKNNDNSPKITKNEVLEMNAKDLLTVLENNGLVVPKNYSVDNELVESFVYEYTPKIIRGEINPTVGTFGYSKNNELLYNLGSVLFDLNLIDNNSIHTLAAYKLKDSTSVGSWNNAYRKYNCYSYSINRTNRWYNPGDFSGEHFDLTMSVSKMADVVLADLKKLGYIGYKTTTKPTNLPNNYFRVIAIRKANNNKDYHFMKQNGTSLNSWYHKPGNTQPLKWKYSSPSAKVWTNEAIANGITSAPTITYNSQVYYILYKNKNDPGVQPVSLPIADLLFN